MFCRGHKKTLSLQLNLMCPRSPHLKHVGLLLLSVVITLVVLCVTVPTVVPMLLLCHHGVLRLVDLVVPVIGWSICGGDAVCIMESFLGVHSGGCRLMLLSKCGVLGLF